MGPLKTLTSVFLIVAVLQLWSACNIIPASQCENVADIVKQATMFLCEQGDPLKRQARTDQIANQLITELRKYNSNPEAQTLIAKLEGARLDQR